MADDGGTVCVMPKALHEISGGIAASLSFRFGIAAKSHFKQAMLVMQSLPPSMVLADVSFLLDKHLSTRKAEWDGAISKAVTSR
jgi:hypothetical protein